MHSFEQYLQYQSQKYLLVSMGTVAIETNITINIPNDVQKNPLHAPSRRYVSPYLLAFTLLSSNLSTWVYIPDKPA